MTRARQLLLTMLVTVACVLLAGWWSDLRTVLHAALLVLVVVFAWPFALIIGLMLLLYALVFFGALMGSDVNIDGPGEAVVKADAGSCHVGSACCVAFVIQCPGASPRASCSRPCCTGR
jgi:hypothetical protein